MSEQLMDVKFKYFLTLDNNTTELIFSPLGWDEQTIGMWKRDLSYFGLIRSLAMPLTFVYDGADILRIAFNKYGIEAGVLLEVKERNELWGYDNIFSSNLDFSKYKPDGDSIGITLLESGVGKEIKSKENIKYEFPLIGNDVVNIILPGVKFSEKSTWITKIYFGEDNSGYISGMDLVTNNYGSGFAEARNTEAKTGTTTNVADCFVIGKRSGGLPVNIKGTLKGNASPLVVTAISLRSTKNPFLVQTLLPSAFRPSFDFTFEFTANIDLDEGWYIYLNSPLIRIEEGEISVEYSSVSDPSNCKGIRVNDLFKRIINRISPSTSVTSNHLSTTRANLIITSGSAIREIADAKIKISLKEFFQTCYALDDVGLGLDGGILRLEVGNSYMRNVQIMDVGNVNSYSMDIAEELIYNAIKTGYNDGNTDDENGREEWNSGQDWELPISSIQNELNLISPTRADQYGIEQIRVKFNVSKTATSDNKSDNDTFMVDCNPINGDGNFTPILGSQLESVSGLPFPESAYNLLLSPKRHILNHSGFIRSFLDKQDGRYIEFGSAEKNATINVTNNGLNVNEDADIRVADLPGKYFKPYVFTINAKLPKNAMQIIDSRPFGYITFNYNGVTASGFIMEVSIDLAGDSAMEIKLLSTEFSLIP